MTWRIAIPSGGWWVWRAAPVVDPAAFPVTGRGWYEWVRE